MDGQDAPRLAVFLGNPGAEYARNRHNAGRMLAAGLLAARFPGLSWVKKFRGLYVPLPQSAALPRAVHFLMPETYMNLSGESAAAAAAFFKIGAGEIIVAHDELELAPGVVSFKFGGGAGGHNGLRSIKQSLGTADFWRLRIGIGRPPGRRPGAGGPPVKGAGEGGPGDVAAWVLSDFAPAEEPPLAAALTAAGDALFTALTSGPGGLLPEWAKKDCFTG